MARKLKNVLIEEITICDEPANRKKFFIKKYGGLKMDKLLEILKKLLGEDNIDDKSIEKIKGIPEDKVEDIRKVLEEIEGYQENFPPALDEAFLSLAKSAVYDYPVKESEFDFEDIEKAGASLSKATVAQLKKIQEIIVGLIGEKTKKFKTAKEDDKEVEIPEEIQAKLDKLDKLEKDEKERVEKEAEEKQGQKDKDFKDLKEEVEKLKKTKGTKKSIDGQEDGAGDEEDDVVAIIPSLPAP